MLPLHGIFCNPSHGAFFGKSENCVFVYTLYLLSTHVLCVLGGGSDDSTNVKDLSDL